RVAGVTGEDENRHPERWIVSPPAGGVGIVFPGTLAAAEHPPSHHDGAGRAERFRNERIVGTGLAAVAKAVALAKAREPEEPFVQPLASVAQRPLEARVRSGDEAVQRHRDL